MRGKNGETTLSVRCQSRVSHDDWQFMGGEFSDQNFASRRSKNEEAYCHSKLLATREGKKFAESRIVLQYPCSEIPIIFVMTYFVWFVSTLYISCFSLNWRASLLDLISTSWGEADPTSPTHEVNQSILLKAPIWALHTLIAIDCMCNRSEENLSLWAETDECVRYLHTKEFANLLPVPNNFCNTSFGQTSECHFYLLTIFEMGIQKQTGNRWVFFSVFPVANFPQSFCGGGQGFAETEPFFAFFTLLRLWQRERVHLGAAR